MKNIVFLIVATTLFSCMPKELPTVLTMSDDQVTMKVSHQTTQEELTSMASKLEQQNIKIDFTGSTFFKNDRLQKLILRVTMADGTSGMTTADIVALQYRYFGFLYQKAGSPAFKIGEI